jgi:RIO-like serine/threonine protein kinase
MGGVCTSRPDVIERKKQLARIKTIEGVPVEKDTKKAVLKSSELIAKAFSKESEQGETSRTKFHIQTNALDKNFSDLKSDLTPTKSYSHKNNFEYIKGECIGSGTLSSVYSGLSINTGEIVAIKSIKLTPEIMEQQINEINDAVGKLSKLQHKNIIKYISTQPSELPGEIDIILEYCNGGSIKQLLEKFDAFDEKLIKLYVRQILEGLLYLHEQNIVHRNIKNCNVLVDGNGTVKLSDFVVSNVLIGDDSEAILYFNTNNGQGKNFLN